MAGTVQPTTGSPAERTTALSVSRLWPVFFAALLGVSIIYGVGLANSSALHNAAHDTRHSLAFPCH
ncbi:MAG: cobalt transporter [Rhodospirillaceae bacterium]|nr:cobalt transporter [Rhodospirillaceae bacterium]